MKNTIDKIITVASGLTVKYSKINTDLTDIILSDEEISDLNIRLNIVSGIFQTNGSSDSTNSSENLKLCIKVTGFDNEDVNGNYWILKTEGENSEVTEYNSEYDITSKPLFTNGKYYITYWKMLNNWVIINDMTFDPYNGPYATAAADKGYPYNDNNTSFEWTKTGQVLPYWLGCSISINNTTYEYSSTIHSYYPEDIDERLDFGFVFGTFPWCVMYFPLGLKNIYNAPKNSKWFRYQTGDCLCHTFDDNPEEGIWYEGKTTTVAENLNIKLNKI